MKRIYTLLFASIATFSAQSQVAFSAGSTVPDFTITDLDGIEHSLYEYTSQGKYVVVDFFAYWCGPCAATAPTINEFHHAFGCNAGDVIVLGVEYEGTEEQTHEFEEWAGVDDDNSYPVASGISGGGAEVHAAYGAAAFPTIIAITPDNILLDNDIWPIASMQTIVDAFPKNSINEMECVVGIDENITTNKFTLAPNPSADGSWLNAELAGNIEQLDITVYDATGKMIVSEQWNNLTSGTNRTFIDTRELSTGIYHIQLSTGGNVIHSQKLIRQ